MKAIIMAGGQGTRLRPLTCSVPKPLSLLCGRPVVNYILDLLDEHGFDEAIFTLGYKAEQIEQLFENGRYKGIRLRFSHEDSPLGTAGCVKKAFKMFNSASPDDFLVISGDALCDFNLTAAIRRHKETNAQATIITKRVDDPREYGLVLTEKSRDGRITGFSEKPSYLSCIDDCANTGVYVLSPAVMELIPDNAPCDFARDVFAKMLNDNRPMHAHEERGYWCDIGDFSTYMQSQFDIISGKVRCHIDKARIHGNSYIGQNVDMGTGTRIDSCVIGDNVSIGSNVKLINSVVLDSAFISDGATVNGAIICRGARLLHSSSAYEGSVIGEGCIIGREAIVSGGVKVWNDKSVPPGANITRDVKYGNRAASAELSDSGIVGETNADITPELCSRLGAALAVTSTGVNSRRIAVSSDEDNASVAMKHAILAGASGAGADVFDIGTAPLPQLIYAAGLLNCGILAQVSCGLLTEIEILGSGGLYLTRQEERRLEAAVARSEYKNADRNGFGKIHSLFDGDGGFGFERFYTSMLYRYTGFKSRYRVKLNSDNVHLSQSLSPVFESIHRDNSSGDEVIVVTLTDGGAKAEMYTEGNVKVGYEQLLLLAAAAVMKNGNDVALPNDFAAAADFLAASYGRQIHRYFLCSNDSRDEYARELAARQPFLRDGAVLALTVLRELSTSGMSISAAVKAIPQFASVRREVAINCPPQRIISRLCETGCGKGEGVLIGDSRENVLIRSAKRGNSLFLFAESLSSETAAQLCDNAEDLIKNMMKEMNE
ncbi:MAG: sugar phosphate nucleotidyltransferase [Oscillospiraceae bacterium]|nr:sugar phosphate nucleotidyltransferase [Oscillospiraceae bacterium]